MAPLEETSTSTLPISLLLIYLDNALVNNMKGMVFPTLVHFVTFGLMNCQLDEFNDDQICVICYETFKMTHDEVLRDCWELDEVPPYTDDLKNYLASHSLGEAMNNNGDFIQFSGALAEIEARGHVFYWTYICRWHYESNTCPVCKREICNDDLLDNNLNVYNNLEYNTNLHKRASRELLPLLPFTTIDHDIVSHDNGTPQLDITDMEVAINGDEEAFDRTVTGGEG